MSTSFLAKPISWQDKSRDAKRRMLSLASKGRGNKEIAVIIGKSEGHVRNAMSDIYDDVLGNDCPEMKRTAAVVKAIVRGEI